VFDYKSEVEGKAGIIARVVAKSVSSITGKVITTYELEYPRFIHSELMTHRIFSRNAASSRAIPIKKTIEQVRLAPAMPVEWGKNQPGMQAKELLTGEILDAAKNCWLASSQDSAYFASRLDGLGAHKQIANRILEPFVFMKTVLTTTEEANWYYLRDHEDADPTICELAKCMWQATALVEDVELHPGDWHVPYYYSGYWKGSGYVNKNMDELFNKRDSESTLANSLAISSSCCAQVSFRLLDGSLEKADNIYDRLVNSKPVHASPFEHQAMPIFEHVGNGAWNDLNDPSNPSGWQAGITHADRNGNLWSGNFCGWIQHRQLIPNNAVYG